MVHCRYDHMTALYCRVASPSFQCAKGTGRIESGHGQGAEYLECTVSTDALRVRECQVGVVIQH
jgi:hypothetical protein